MSASLATTFAVAALLIPLAGPASQAQTRETDEVNGARATERVDALHELLIGVMHTQTYEARVQMLREPVGVLFDAQTISRISLGSTWRDLSEKQRSDFQRLLMTLIVATYADRFDSFDDQHFETLATKEAGRGWMVTTRLHRKSGDPVNLDYYFRGERVFNVVADGVSDLSLRRAEYRSIVKRDGFDALLGEIEANITAYGQPGS